jgi:hypothetical protein
VGKCQFETTCSNVRVQKLSITSSARASNDGGTVMPSIFAVLALITSSNLIGCSTAMSVGLPPCRIFVTNSVRSAGIPLARRHHKTSSRQPPRMHGGQWPPVDGT